MKQIIYFLILIFAVACSSAPEISDEMIDSGKIYDLSNYPGDKLLSVRIPSPSEADKNTPVVIAVHGYSATTFEWDELRDFSEEQTGTKFYVSQVLLGGHGSTYENFKSAGWKVWQTSIIEEYNKLQTLGYKNIYLIGSSTACPLIINLLKDGFFNKNTSPKAIYFIDPIIVSSNKTLTLVSLAGPILGYTKTDIQGDEIKYWYSYRPYESLQELMNLIDLTRKQLQKGIEIPESMRLKTYKSISDGSADPVSAVLIYKGIKYPNGKSTDVEMMNSDLHVFTRLRLRENVTESDRQLQLKVFNDLVAEF